MHRPRLALALLPLLPLLGACLEREERLVVRPDGSVRVTLTARGDVQDLVDGHPVPFGGPWLAASPDAERWLREVGPATGGAGDGLRERALRAWPGGTTPGDAPQPELRVEATFASVADLPRTLAPASEVYASAHLVTDTSLEIREVGGRRVYLLERVYRGFDAARLDVGARISLPPELESRLEEGATLGRAEALAAAELVAPAFEEVALELARQAILGIYTQGDAGLPAPALADVLSEVRAAARAAVGTERLAAAIGLRESQPERLADALESIEAEWRAAVRAALDASLLRHGVAAPTRHAALFALEWQLTALDQANDLGDEEITVRILLPGTLVGGNYDEATDGEALWKLEGQRLREHDVVLRAVSVLE